MDLPLFDHSLIEFHFVVIIRLLGLDLESLNIGFQGLKGVLWLLGGLVLVVLSVGVFKYLLGTLSELLDLCFH